MEILLDRGVVTTMGYGAVIAIFTMVFGLIAVIVSVCSNHYELAGFFVMMVILAIVLPIIYPEYTFDVPTKTHKYVVEITDAEKYKDLVDNGYTLDKLYDNRDIYMLTGDVIE